MKVTQRLPRWVYLPAFIGLGVVVLPLLALLPRVQWATFWQDITEPTVAAALALSAKSALIAVFLCVLLGVPLALLIARVPQGIAAVLRTIVTLPLVLPPLVGGVALLAILGRNGFLGAFLEQWGLPVAFTPAAVVVAQTFVAMPFLVISVEGALRTRGTEYEKVATGLGAGKTRVVTRVTLPLIMPALLAGIVLAFARSLGEFGATALLAGNRPGATQTIPMAIYTAFNGVGTSRQAAMALSVLLVATALVVLLFFPAARGGMVHKSLSTPPTEDSPLEFTLPDAPQENRGRPLEVDITVERPGFTLTTAFSLAAGHVLAVVGPNAAGKSTLMDAVSGALAPTSGNIALGTDHLVADGAVVPAQTRPIGVLEQHPLLFPHLTLEENVAFGLRSHGVRKKQAHTRAQELLAAVGLAELGQRKPNTLSGGQQQRVALVRTLAIDPAVLILDEPLAALDISSAPLMRRIIAYEVSRTGMTTLLVTHDPLDVLTMADSVLVLEQGKVSEQQSVDEFFSSPSSVFGSAFTGVNTLPGEHGMVHATEDQLHLASTDEEGESSEQEWVGVVTYGEVVGGKGIVHLTTEGRPVRVACEVSLLHTFTSGRQVRVVKRPELLEESAR